MLVIIDMQELFPAATESFVVKNVMKLCRRSIRRSKPIIAVSFRRYGPLIYEINSIIKSYGNFFHTFKDEDDGSWQIYKSCKNNKINPRNVWICGVNTNACVARTTIGLSKLYPKSRIIVKAEACNDYSGATENYTGWAERCQNVVWTGEKYDDEK